MTMPALTPRNPHDRDRVSFALNEIAAYFDVLGREKHPFIWMQEQFYNLKVRQKLNQAETHYVRGFYDGMLEHFARTRCDYRVGQGFFHRDTEPAQIFMSEDRK